MKTLSLTLAAAMIATAAAGAVAPAQADSDSAAAAAAAYRVTLKSSTNDAVQSEDKVSLTGKVTPKAPGTKVTVQIQYEGKKAWNSIGTAKVKERRLLPFVDKPTSRLERSYRVVKPGDNKATKGISKARGGRGVRLGLAGRAAPPAPAQDVLEHLLDADQR